MPTTIGDVARRAGVSTATVSRVLTGQGRARPETRDRVVAAARDLGYRPSGVARSLRQRATRTIGLIVTDIENPFFPQLVRAVEDAARELGYAILLCNADDDPERESGYLDLLVDRWVDGVVIAASSLGGRHREWLADAPLPIVLVNSAERGLGLSTVASDNRAGGALAASHLIELGHRRFAILAAPPRNIDGPDRLAAPGRRSRRGRGRGRGPCRGRRGGRGWRRAGAAEALAADPHLTAIVAYNDLMAIGAMRAVRASGRRVPADVSVVGFDDVDLAGYVDPPLTTIAQATSEMGRWAVTRLAEELAARTAARAGAEAPPVEATTANAAAGGERRDDSDGPSPAHLVLPVSLRVRESTGPAPR
jgi:LacI family transcriptional regulator